MVPRDAGEPRGHRHRDRTNNGYYPVSGHSIRFVVSSDFLFTDPSHGVHLVLALNYEPVFSNEYISPNWYYSHLGNQFQGLILGNFGCGLSAAFEAKYQIPRWYWSDYWGQGWYWGVTGVPDDITANVQKLT